MTTPDGRYGSAQVRRSLGHFMLGKGLGAVIGVAWLLLLVRTLPTADYGAYFAIYAYLELALLLSGYGAAHAIERFVPALHAAGHSASVRRLVLRMALLRLLTLLAVAGLGWVLTAPLAQALGLGAQASALRWIQAIVVLEGLCRLIDTTHEALLLQRKAQISMLWRSGARLGALLALWLGGATLDVGTWLAVEAAVSLVGLVLAGGLYAHTQAGWPAAEPGPPAALPAMAPYLGALFAAQLLAMLYSSDAIKLLVNRFEGLQASALLGFALALALVVQRYVPTQLLAGLVRPLFVVAGQAQPGPQRPDRLASLATLCLKLNALILLPLLAGVAWHEGHLLGLSSGGRFTAHQGVMSLALAVLSLQSLRSVLALVSTGLGDARGPLWAAAGSAALILVSVPLAVAADAGLRGWLLAWLLAEGAGTLLLLLRTRHLGVALRLSGLVRVFTVCVGALALARVAAQLAQWGSGGQLALAGCALVLAGLLTLRSGFFTPAEAGQLLALLPARWQAGLARLLGLRR